MAKVFLRGGNLTGAHLAAQQQNHQALTHGNFEILAQSLPYGARGARF